MTTSCDSIKPGSDRPPDLGIRHSIPDEQLHDLAGFLRLAAIMRDGIFSELLGINRRLPKPLPAFSAGGLVDCVNAVLAAAPGVTHE